MMVEPAFSAKFGRGIRLRFVFFVLGGIGSIWAGQNQLPGIPDSELFGDNRPLAPPLDSLITIGLQMSPAIEVSEARTLIASAGERRARAFAPPEIALETGRKTLGMMDNPESMPFTGITVRQMIMNPSQLQAMGSAEKARLSMSRHETDYAKLLLAKEIRLAYWDLYMLQGQWKVNRDHRRFVESSIESARRNYEVGMGRLGDVLRAQTESSRLRSDALILAQKHAAMEAMLDARLGKRLNPRIGWIAEPTAPNSPLPPADSMVFWGLGHRPELLAMRDGVEMAKRENVAANRSRWGDFMVEGKWMAMQGPDEWAMMAGITVPLAPWASGEVLGKRAATQGRMAESRAEVRKMENMVQAEIRDAISGVETSRRLLELADGVSIPQADQALASAESAYRSGKLEFMMLLEFYHMSHMAHEDRYMAMAKERQGWAILEAAIGMPREAWPWKSENEVRK